MDKANHNDEYFEFGEYHTVEYRQVVIFVLKDGRSFVANKEGLGCMIIRDGKFLKSIGFTTVVAEFKDIGAAKQHIRNVASGAYRSRWLKSLKQQES